MTKADKMKVITLIDENRAIINEANRRINEVRRSKWKSTPALEATMPGLKKVGTKRGLFSVSKQQDLERAERTVAEAKRYVKMDTSTVEGYEKLMDEREQRFRDRYGEGWGTTDLSRKQFFDAISSKWYHRLHDAGVNSEILIKYATVYSENTKSKDPKAAKRAFKRLYEKMIFTDLETSFTRTSESFYVTQLIDKRTKILTGRAGNKASIYDVYTKAWYDGDDESDVEL